MGLSIRMEALFSLAVSGVMQQQKRGIQKYLFRLGLADAVFVRTLSAVAVVPVKSCDLGKVYHFYILL